MRWGIEEPAGDDGRAALDEQAFGKRACILHAAETRKDHGAAPRPDDFDLWTAAQEVVDECPVRFEQR